MLLWIRWTWPGLQFILCLCLYDGFLTVLDLNFNALLADLAVSVNARSYLNSYSSIFSGFGTTTVFLSYAVWNRNDLIKFQIFCGVLAILSAFGFFFSATILRREYMKMNKFLLQTVETPDRLVYKTVLTQVFTVQRYRNMLCITKLPLSL